MMHLIGFATKKALLARVKLANTPKPPMLSVGAVIADPRTGTPLHANRVCVETSMFGPELRDNGIFCVCLDHPRRSKFAEITVCDGHIVAAK